MPTISFFAARADGRLDELCADVSDAEWALCGDPYATELSAQDLADLLDIETSDARELIDAGAFGAARPAPGGPRVTVAGYAAYRDLAYPELPSPIEVAVSVITRRRTGRPAQIDRVEEGRPIAQIRADARPARTIALAA